MITQSAIINESQVETLRKFFKMYEGYYPCHHFEARLMRLPIFGEVDGEIKRIGTEGVYIRICKSQCDGKWRLQVYHESYFD